MEPQVDLLSTDLQVNIPRRRLLLPWWVKIFVWIFLVFGAIVPVAFVFALLGYKYQISLYGVDTDMPFSLTGFSLLTIFLLKGFTAFSLWMSKDWAINLGLVDAALGIAICVYVMFISPFFETNGFVLHLRLELLLLIPYLLWLRKIKSSWDESKVISVV